MLQSLQWLPDSDLSPFVMLERWNTQAFMGTTNLEPREQASHFLVVCPLFLPGL